MKTLRLVITLSIAISCNHVYSQSTTGSIYGRVVDANGDGVDAATILANGSKAFGTASAITDGEGRFTIVNLPPDTYTLRTHHLTYRDIILDDIPVKMGNASNTGDLQALDNLLQLEPIYIVGEEHTIDLKSSEISIDISTRAYEDLPTTRDYVGLLQFLPGANNSYAGDGININGFTGGDLGYYINNMRATDVIDLQGTVQLPYQFVDVVEVKMDGISAEYGGQPGPVINVLTKTGTNEFQSSIFSFYTSDFLSNDSREALAEAIDKTAKYDFGAGFSGPIIKDKLWYFAALNRVESIKDISLPGQSGLFRDKTVTHLFAGKLSWKINEKNDVELFLQGDPTSRDIIDQIAPLSGLNPLNVVDPDPLLSQNTSGGTISNVNFRSRISDHLIMEVSAGYLSRNDDTDPKTNFGKNNPALHDLFNGTVSGGGGVFFRQKSRRWQFGSSVKFVNNKHDLKVGWTYEQSGGSDWLTGPGIYISPDSLRSFFRVTFDSQQRVFKVNSISTYVNDRLAINDQLTMNLGLRYSADFVSDNFGISGFSITDKVSPRLGITYSWSANDKLFASYGRYFLQQPLRYITFAQGTISNTIEFYDANPVENNVDPIFIQDFPPLVISDKKLKGHAQDAFALGYKTNRYGVSWSVTGRYRRLKQALSMGYAPDSSQFFGGNPGRGVLSFLPKLENKYSSLEIAAASLSTGKLKYNLAYTLSRHEGNFGGLADQDRNTGFLQGNESLLGVDQIPNSYGLLPNDHTHQFKAQVSYQPIKNVVLGAFFNYATGFPLNRWGQALAPFRPLHLEKRGSVGRTDAITTLDIRITYKPKLFKTDKVESLLFIDLFNLGPRSIVRRDQTQFNAIQTNDQGSPIFDENGLLEQNPAAVNPGYLMPTAFTDPFSARLGLQIDIR